MGKRKSVLCCMCGSEVSLSNITKHKGSLRCQAGGKQTANPSLECKHCLKTFSSSSGRALHEIQCDENPERVYRKTNYSWNRGLTAETDERVRKGADKLKISAQRPGHGQCKNPEKEAERRAKISQKMRDKGFGGYRENAGRSKKFRVVDSYGNPTTLQSSYELRCSELLNELGIHWIRPKALKYDGRNYFADFYLPEFDIWLDPKNSFKAGKDAEKIKKVIEQNGVKLFVILEHNLTLEYIKKLCS